METPSLSDIFPEIGPMQSPMDTNEEARSCIGSSSSPIIVYEKPALNIEKKVPNPITPQVKLFFGPMYYGKTRALQKHVLGLALMGYNCIIFKFTMDNRYDQEEGDLSLIAHDNHALTPKSHHLITIRRVEFNFFLNYFSDPSLFPDINRFSVIAIDEVQFLKGEKILLHLMDRWVDEMNKVLIFASLNMWANGDDVKQVKDIMTRVEEPKFKSGPCSQCFKNKAIRSVTKEDYNDGFKEKKKPIIKVGGLETYISICRICYNTARNKGHALAPIA